MSDNILRARGLKKHFTTGGVVMGTAGVIRAVDDVSFDIRRGETFAIVGESGCGKSTLARLLMRLLSPTEGDVIFDGIDVRSLKGRDLTALRRDMQFIFQDPFSSLNPRMSVGKLIGEPLETHFPDMSGTERRAKVSELLDKVGLRPEHAERYPHEFSGGQRQRIAIARALAVDPEFIVADEPISALDVSIQAQVLNLLMEAQESRNLTYLFITHDLAVVEHFGTRVAVMYLGRVCELADTRTLFNTPRHPYTQALLSAIPKLEDDRPNHIRLQGEVPTPVQLPSGCVFHGRCPYADDRCRQEIPQLIATDGGAQVACHAVEEGRL